MRGEGGPVAAGDRASEGLRKLSRDSGSRRAFREGRQGRPGLLFRDFGLSSGSRGYRDNGNRSPGRQGCRRMVERFGLGLDPVGPGSNRGHDLHADAESLGVPFHRDECAVPGLVGRSREDAQGVE